MTPVRTAGNLGGGAVKGERGGREAPADKIRYQSLSREVTRRKERGGGVEGEKTGRFVITG